jgi:hypothetical protein
VSRDDDEPLEFGGERIELLLQPREEAGLAVDPRSAVPLRFLDHELDPTGLRLAPIIYSRIYHV